MPPRLPLLSILLLAGLLCQSQSPGQVPTRDDVDTAQTIDLPSDPAAIVAYVGRTPILLGDLMPKVTRESMRSFPSQVRTFRKTSFTLHVSISFGDCLLKPFRTR